MRILPSTMHAQLDYVFIIIFVMLATFSGWGSPLSWLLVALGLTSWVYSLLTRYELGLINLIPLRVHLALDMVSGFFLMVAAFLWLDQAAGLTIWFVAVGLVEIIIALLAETEPQQQEQQIK
jgi:hypothetical protein